MDRKSGRNTDGTFASGNSGKPKGSRHRATRAALAMLDGQSEALTAKAVELGLGGDVTALRLCLERIAPPRRDAPVTFALPALTCAADAARAAAAILAAVSDGELTPTEGGSIMALVETWRRTFELTQIETRLSALEGTA
jgi:hypothetical protein